MVVFVCTQCNATLKKSAVKNHLSFKKCTTVSCVDCHKDFDKNSVESHCFCISEKEKYDKPRFKESSKGNKVCTQSEWIMKIEDLIKNCQSTNHKRLLENLRGCHNIPKKKNKFEVFNGYHFQLSVQHIQHILTEFGGKAPFSDVRKMVSVQTPSDLKLLFLIR
ncbi:unnamed protein product [Trichobilharzia regenti]|nr:unnamed protein product [Trichobilharzia regenti]